MRHPDPLANFRLPCVGVLRGTEEQRKHEPQLLQLRNENAILQELEVEKAYSELELEARRHLGYKPTTSKSPKACYEHSGFDTPWTPGDEPEPNTPESELQVGTSEIS